MAKKDHHSALRPALLLADNVVFSVILLAVAWLSYGINQSAFIWQLALVLPVSSFSLYVLSAIDIESDVSKTSLVSRAIASVVLTGLLLFVFIYLLGPGSAKYVFGRGILGSSMIVFSLYLIASRIYFLNRIRRTNPAEGWLFVGEESHYNSLRNEVKILKWHRFERRTLTWLSENLDENSVFNIIFDQEVNEHSELVRKLLRDKFNGAKVYSIDQFYERYLEKIPVFHVTESWFIGSTGFDYVRDSIRQRLKRVGDILIVLLFFPLTAVLSLAAILAILLVDRMFPFFIQPRVGASGREFKIYKLTTMKNSVSRSEGKWTAKNDVRITSLGKILRRYRIDELPQLVNVLKGEMSIVGPRPEQPSYTKILTEEIPHYDLRHIVKPGITGWAQVKYPYGASVQDSIQKLEYDLYYIKNYSILLDFNILLKTVSTLFSGGGR